MVKPNAAERGLLTHTYRLREIGSVGSRMHVQQAAAAAGGTTTKFYILYMYHLSMFANTILWGGGVHSALKCCVALFFCPTLIIVLHSFARQREAALPQKHTAPNPIYFARPSTSTLHEQSAHAAFPVVVVPRCSLQQRTPIKTRRHGQSPWKAHQTRACRSGGVGEEETLQ